MTSTLLVTCSQSRIENILYTPPPTQPPPPPMVRQRKDPSKTAKTSKTTDVEPSHSVSTATSMRASHREQDPLLSSSSLHPPPPSYDEHDTRHQQLPVITAMRSRTQWLALAIASGACAAFNGVFAKLTTTELTTSWAAFISSTLGLQSLNKLIEILTRATFFALNLLFNGIMWALFTSALTRSPSTTRVSIVNTSANFVLTAVLGFLIFAESLPPLWWLGASLLVVGNVVIGRRDREGAEEDEGRGGGMVGDIEIAGSVSEDGKERDGEGVVFWGDGADVGVQEELGLEDDSKGGLVEVDSDDPVRGPSVWDRSS